MRLPPRVRLTLSVFSVVLLPFASARLRLYKMGACNRLYQACREAEEKEEEEEEEESERSAAPARDKCSWRSG